MAGEADRLNIRDTGVSILEILDLMALGLRYETILGRYPGLVAEDIAYAAATARYLIIRYWAACGEPLTESIPAGGRPGREGWSIDEEAELVNLYRSGATVAEIGRILRRSSAEAEKRLKELLDNKQS
ncbi:MAG: DUF433 domain-containing protein [Candidatus Zixiibacteriota bacterium]